MLNQFVFVGRLLGIGKKSIKVGNDDKDTEIYISISEALYNDVKDNCKVGDMIAIKGKITGKTVLTAEKLTYLLSIKGGETK